MLKCRGPHHLQVMSARTTLWLQAPFPLLRVGQGLLDVGCRISLAVSQVLRPSTAARRP
jgi:hypothetical protein